jgi:hypothetical protein
MPKRCDNADAGSTWDETTTDSANQVLSEIDALLEQMRDYRNLSPFPMPEHMHSVATRIEQLARVGADPLIELCYGSILEIIAHVVLRLRLAVRNELEQVNRQAGLGPLAPVTSGLSRNLALTEELAHVLSRVTDSFARYQHVHALVERARATARPSQTRLGTCSSEDAGGERPSLEAGLNSPAQAGPRRLRVALP